MTSDDFTQVLKDHGIRISMDGKGRWMDNVFVIIGYYSRYRPHQHNGGLLPNKVEEDYQLSSKTVGKNT